MTTHVTTEKEIRYDRATKDYACYLGGELIGYRRTYGEAETFISETYTQQLADQVVPINTLPTRIEPYGCPDEDEDIHGTRVLCGYGDDMAEVYFPDNPAKPHNVPQVFILGCDGFDLQEFARVFPRIVAVMSDPRVQAALSAA